MVRERALEAVRATANGFTQEMIEESMTLPEHTRQPLGPNQERWLKALESGEYKQGRSKLRSPADTYCCLGVACEVARIPGHQPRPDSCWLYGEPGEIEWESWAPESLKNHLALYKSGGEVGVGKDGKSLVDLNDTGKSFSEIAAIIRSDPSVYFKEPR